MQAGVPAGDHLDLRALSGDLLAAAAALRRLSFASALPWIAERHTLEEDVAFWRNVVAVECTVIGAFLSNQLVGSIAFRPGWIDQLYVLPEAQGRGAGSALLAAALAGQHEMSLWTFQRNAPARRFYERHGFRNVEETDGARNEEREPDVRYLWRR